MFQENNFQTSAIDISMRFGKQAEEFDLEAVCFLSKQKHAQISEGCVIDSSLRRGETFDERFLIILSAIPIYPLTIFKKALNERQSANDKAIHSDIVEWFHISNQRLS